MTSVFKLETSVFQYIEIFIFKIKISLFKFITDTGIRIRMIDHDLIFR